MVTIREIAQRAGYSQATVSRLLNGDPTLSVKDDTRRKIIAVSEELGYATQTPRIALPRAVAVLSNFTPDEDLQDAYFNELRDVLERSAGRQRMDLTSFSAIGELIGQAAHFDGFIAIGPRCCLPAICTPCTPYCRTACSSTSTPRPICSIRCSRI